MGSPAWAVPCLCYILGSVQGLVITGWSRLMVNMLLNSLVGRWLAARCWRTPASTSACMLVSHAQSTHQSECSLHPLLLVSCLW